jgi:hypothetical protein
MSNTGLATLTNCTFSNNRTTLNPAFGGGGIFNGPNVGVGPTISLTNCTLANNSAGPGFGGGIWNAAGCTLHLTNTIVAQNTAASGPDVFGSINTADHNLIGDGGGSTIVTDLGGNLIGGNGNPVIDPRLGPLQDNGGPTQTLALYADSPAIDAGNNAYATDFDQRGPGFPRIVNGIIDIGAFEFQGAGPGLATSRSSRGQQARLAELVADLPPAVRHPVVEAAALSPGQGSTVTDEGPFVAPWEAASGLAVPAVDSYFATVFGYVAW